MNMNNTFFDYFLGELKPTIDIDVEEYDDKISIKAYVPGFSKENIKIEFRNGFLFLKGKKEQDKNIKYMYKESENEFDRRVYLGNYYDLEKTVASCKDGILTIDIPKNKKLTSTITIQ